MGAISSREKVTAHAVLVSSSLPITTDEVIVIVEQPESLETPGNLEPVLEDPICDQVYVPSYNSSTKRVLGYLAHRLGTASKYLIMTWGMLRITSHAITPDATSTIVSRCTAYAIVGAGSYFTGCLSSCACERINKILNPEKNSLIPRRVHPNVTTSTDDHMTGKKDEGNIIINSHYQLQLMSLRG